MGGGLEADCPEVVDVTESEATTRKKKKTRRGLKPKAKAKVKESEPSPGGSPGGEDDPEPSPPNELDIPAFPDATEAMTSAVPSGSAGLSEGVSVHEGPGEREASPGMEGSVGQSPSLDVNVSELSADPGVRAKLLPGTER